MGKALDGGAVAAALREMAGRAGRSGHRRDAGLLYEAADMLDDAAGAPAARVRSRAKLFVWTGIFTNYSHGLAVALAPDYEHAVRSIVGKAAFPGFAERELREVKPLVIRDPSAARRVSSWHVEGGG